MFPLLSSNESNRKIAIAGSRAFPKQTYISSRSRLLIPEQLRQWRPHHFPLATAQLGSGEDRARHRTWGAARAWVAHARISQPLPCAAPASDPPLSLAWSATSPGGGAGARLILGPQQPRRRDEHGNGHAAGSAAPRRAAPCSAREPRARAPRTPRPARLVLPRPPAARGGGGARPAPRSSADAGGGACAGVPSAPGSGGGWVRTAARGGAPRAALGPGSAVPTPTAVHCGAESGAAMNSAAGRASERASERARGPPPGLSSTRSLACAVPGAPGPHAQPRPTPDPARTALRRHILQLAAARARRGRASSLPPRRARRRLPPRPRARPGPFSTRPALTCSPKQPQTLAVGSRFRQRAGRDGMDAGARGAVIALCLGVVV
ncbi:mucin-1-like [Onychomys torridus]|uniref:mucin-1-like n=1 Tax=Onychomys torridus TaxID=38674 RepID=UPI00167F3E37|nr:mucin-1-like [Onychomys torridus]